jgi:CDP-6-deoxy-D-xylo-4-hexulose-3-dehydrase
MVADMSTLSFYPAHQITTGEGGAVLTDSPELAKLITSFRDWGKDCYCLPGTDNACGQRFSGPMDHKYQFSHIGYNLKMSDLHAAIGVAQMDKLPQFVADRQSNHAYLLQRMQPLERYFILPPGGLGSA